MQRTAKVLWQNDQDFVESCVSWALSDEDFVAPVQSSSSHSISSARASSSSRSTDTDTGLKRVGSRVSKRHSRLNRDYFLSAT